MLSPRAALSITILICQLPQWSPCPTPKLMDVFVASARLAAVSWLTPVQCSNPLQLDLSTAPFSLPIVAWKHTILWSICT